MTKKIQFSKKPTRIWEEEETKVPEKVLTKRVTFDLDANLHRRMKLDCASRDVNMTEEIRPLLEKRWPAN